MQLSHDSLVSNSLGLIKKETVQFTSLVVLNHKFTVWLNKFICKVYILKPRTTLLYWVLKLLFSFRVHDMSVMSIFGYYILLYLHISLNLKSLLFDIIELVSSKLLFIYLLTIRNNIVYNKCKY